MPQKFPGQLRPSQIVTTFGPGSIVDLPKDSVIVLGLDFWPNQPAQYRPIAEPRLERVLRVKGFRVPVSEEELANVPCSTFPLTRICADCNSLRRNEPDSYKDGFRCKRCGSGNTYAARLITACARGHLDEFPWAEWAHNGKLCKTPDLYLVSLGKTSALGDLIVRCRKRGDADPKATGCGASRSLSGALSPDSVRSLIKRCQGFRPWLQDKEECEADPIGIQRGGSNVYFSVSTSSLSIPPWTSKLYIDIEKYREAITDVISKNPAIAPELVKTLLPDYDPQVVIQALQKRQTVSPDMRPEEWVVLNTRDPITEGNQLEVHPQEIPTSFDGWIGALAIVDRLREVATIRGFTRLSPPDPEMPRDARVLPLAKHQTDWLPGVEVFGEGIFFALNTARVREWESSSPVAKRSRELFDVYQNWRTQKQWTGSSALLPRFILLHTISHIMIRQLALQSGYGSASIRERIYSSGSMQGVLLYTASDGSEGSLGGLARQGRPTLFERTLTGAILSTERCSSDPLCYENDPKVTGTLSGAACHVCSFVSETSCEFSNRLLDRRTVIPSTTEEASYFKDFGAAV